MGQSSAFDNNFSTYGLRSGRKCSWSTSRAKWANTLGYSFWISLCNLVQAALVQLRSPRVLVHEQRELGSKADVGQRDVISN